MAEPLCLSGGAEKKPHWWLTNRMMADKYLRDAKALIATQEPAAMASALSLLDAALILSPRLESAAELKARTLLFLRRFKDVAKMLREHIPSLNRGESLDETASSCSSSSDSSSSCSSSSDSSSSSDGSFQRERSKLLSSFSYSSSAGYGSPAFKCFSVSDLKKKLVGGLCKSCQKDALWRYFVLGQACYHLGLMEDAVALLLTGKRIATDELRRESVCRSDDGFSLAESSISGDFKGQPHTAPKTESEKTSLLLGHIKQLLRRKTSAIAAMDAGLYPEAIRHFTKIVDGRRAAPRGFLAECYALRASAFQSAGRIADAISDCNRTLALEPSSIEALRTRASLFETIRCLPECLHDLEHLKLLYNTMLRDRTLPGPVWKRQTVQYREIPGKLCSLAAKMQELKQKVASGETGNVDYYGLMGLRRGCSRTELERAHLLLNLRHKPEKAASFVEMVEFSDEEEVDSAGDRSKMTSLFLYRMIQRAYFSITKILIQEEEEERLRRALESEETAARTDQAPPPQPAVCQGGFCRDIAIVGSLLAAKSGFGRRPIPVKYEISSN